MKTLKYSVPILIVVIILATTQVVAGKITSYSTIDSIPSEDNEQAIQFEANSENSTVQDSRFSEKQWALTYLKIADLWQITMGSEEILVAVLDTGIDANHEDLQGKIEAEVNFTDSPNADDIYGHGTHIAGIIAAENNQRSYNGN